MHEYKPPRRYNPDIATAIYKRLIRKEGLTTRSPFDKENTPEDKAKHLSAWHTAVHYAIEIKAAQQELESLPEPEFDRFDICEAYYSLESDYNESGWLHERASNQRRKMSTGFQLHRMQFRPSPLLTYDTLTENGQAVYKTNEIAILKKMFRIS